MALSSARYFSKGSVGFGGSTAGAFDKFEQSASPKYHVGYKVEQADGSIYRYVHFGATVNRGVLVAGDVSETSVVDTDNVIVASASSVNTSDGTIGSYFVEITLASVTANMYAGGKFITTDDTGEGYTYDIVGNTATGDPASGNFRLQLLQPLQVALGTTTDFSICANKFHNLEIATTATDAIVVGVSCATITAADNYGWIQTRGVCGVLQDATVPAIGEMVSASSATSGAVTKALNTGTVGSIVKSVMVGRCVDPGDSTGATAVDLMLDA